MDWQRGKLTVDDETREPSFWESVVGEGIGTAIFILFLVLVSGTFHDLPKPFCSLAKALTIVMHVFIQGVMTANGDEMR